MKNHSDRKLHVITGPTSGIGQRIALQMAQTGEELVLVGRNGTELERMQEQISARGAKCSSQLCDLSDLAAVGEVAARIREYAGGRRIVSLTNNAGLQERASTSTASGIDRTFAVNTLAPLYLTDGLRSCLAPGARVFFFGSGTVNPDHPSARRFGFRGGRYLSAKESAQGQWAPGGAPLAGQNAYATSKLCVILFARQLAQLDPEVFYYAFDPGMTPGTGLARDVTGPLRLVWYYALPLLVPFFPGWSTPRRAGRVMRRLLTQPERPGPNGAYFDDGGSTPHGHPDTRNDALAERALRECRELLGEVRDSS